MNFDTIFFINVRFFSVQEYRNITSKFQIFALLRRCVGHIDSYRRFGTNCRSQPSLTNISLSCVTSQKREWSHLLGGESLKTTNRFNSFHNNVLGLFFLCFIGLFFKSQWIHINREQVDITR